MFCSRAFTSCMPRWLVASSIDYLLFFLSIRLETILSWFNKYWSYQVCMLFPYPPSSSAFSATNHHLNHHFLPPAGPDNMNEYIYLLSNEGTKNTKFECDWYSASGVGLSHFFVLVLIFVWLIKHLGPFFSIPNPHITPHKCTGLQLTLFYCSCSWSITFKR